MTVTAALLPPLLAEPHVPRLVCYAPLGRTELSSASLANWSAKVAGLLRDELGLVPGALVSVTCGTGWQTLPVLLGAWWAGAVITPEDDPDAAAAFVADGGDAAADEVFVVSGHPLGAPATTVAGHQRDFTGAVLGQADRFTAPPTLAVAAPAVGGTLPLTVEEVLAAALDARPDPGARVLSRAAWQLPQPFLGTVLATLAAAGTLVQVTDDAADDAAIATAENVTDRR